MNRILSLLLLLLLQLCLFTACEKRNITLENYDKDSIINIRVVEGKEYKGSIVERDDKSLKLYLSLSDTLNIPYSNIAIDSIGAFVHGLAAVLIAGKWGYLNTKGRILITPKYDVAWNFSEYLAPVNINGKYGYIDTTGRVVIKPNFFLAGVFSEGLACVQVNGSLSFINTKGEVIIKNGFEEAYCFSEGLAAVKKGNKWGYINKNGLLIIKPEFDEVSSFKESIAAVKKGKVWGYIDKIGKWVIKPQYYLAKDFSEGFAFVTDTTLKGLNPSTYIDKSGERVFDRQFAFGNIVTNGIASIATLKRKNSDEVTVSWTYWRISDNKQITPLEFDEAWPFHESLAPVRIKNKWGYIDTCGRMVIKPLFDNATNFREGYASVKIGEIWNLINGNGLTVLKTK